jgi:hypothetical protein
MERFFNDPRTIAKYRTGLLGLNIQQLADELFSQGYTRLSIRVRVRALARFGCWLKKRRIAVQDLTMEHARSYLNLYGTVKNGDGKMLQMLATVIDQIEHGHHVFRALWKHAFLKQYEKFSRFLRNELVSNNLHDFRLKKGLDHLDAVRKRFQIITDRFAGFQAQSLNVHVDFPLLQRIALPVTIGSVRYPGIKIHDQRIIRLLEVLLHNGSTIGGWTAKQIHQAVLTTFQLSAKTYGLNQLRYDLRKLKGHALLERDERRYAYRLTDKGVDVALLFLFFHKRLCGPLANSRFHHKPDPENRPNSKLEAAYHKADKAIENIVNLLKAA